MIRVVIDTNILVSDLLQPLGLPAQVFILALSGSLQLCVSGEVYAEYEEVINRPRFQRDQETVAGALYAVREQGFWVKPTETVRACSDPAVPKGQLADCSNVMVTTNFGAETTGVGSGSRGRLLCPGSPGRR